MLETTNIGQNTPLIPTGILIENETLSFNGITAYSATYCLHHNNPESWEQHSLLLKTWIDQASDEDIFHLLYEKYGEFFITSQLETTILDKVKIKAFHFLWKRNPELQRRYPHDPSVVIYTKDMKTEDIGVHIWGKLILDIYHYPDNNKDLNKKKEYWRDTFFINQDGVVYYKGTKTEGKIKEDETYYRFRDAVKQVLSYRA